MPHQNSIYRIRPESPNRMAQAKAFRDKHVGQTYLYAISDGTAIKFGSAWDVASRMKGLQTSHYRELSCLAQILAKKGTEAQVHKVLYVDRLRGEWFRQSPAAMEMVGVYARGDSAALYAHIERAWAALLEKLPATP